MENLTKQINKFKDNCNKQTGEFNTSIKLMEQEQKNQGKKIDKILTKLDGMDEKLDKKYSAKWVQWVVEAVLIIFALASLYFIFEKVGLPIP